MSMAEEEGILDCSMIDLVSSPSSNSGNDSVTNQEEEVFFGPVKLQERIAAYNVRTATEDDDTFPTSLNERQWAELHKEANRLIKRMERSVAPSDSVTPEKLKNNLLKLNPQLETIDLHDKENNPDFDKSMSKVDTLHMETLNTVCNRSPLMPLQINTKTDHSPTKRHNRSFTYTLNKSSLELLPDELTESLPHIDHEGKNKNPPVGILVDLGFDDMRQTGKSFKNSKDLVDGTDSHSKIYPSKGILIEFDDEGLHNEKSLKNKTVIKYGDKVKKGVTLKVDALLIDIDSNTETAKSDKSATDKLQDETMRSLNDARYLDGVKKAIKPDVIPEDVVMVDKDVPNTSCKKAEESNGTEINSETDDNVMTKAGLGATTAEKNGKKDTSKASIEDNKMETLKVADNKLEVSEKDKAKPKPSGLSRLRPPSFRTKDRTSVPTLQKLQKPQVLTQATDPCTVAQPKLQLSQPNKSSSYQPTITQPKSRLSIPQQKGMMKKSPLEQKAPAAKSRLSFPKTETSSSASKLQKQSTAGPVKTSTVRNIGTLNPGKAAPASKLQVLKPSGLQRPSVNTKPGDNLKKLGPMKAFKPTGTVSSSSKQNTEQATSHITPAKVEKTVKRTNLAASFASPKLSQSINVESPAASAKKRSNLPTPNKSRYSIGSVSSPCHTRSSGTPSNKSLPPPLVTGSASKRRASVTKNCEKNVSEFNDRSPSSMMAKKPPVVNTPNLPKKKTISPWSPIQKKRPLDQLEEVTRCTKVKK